MSKTLALHVNTTLLSTFLFLYNSMPGDITYVRDEN